MAMEDFPDFTFVSDDGCVMEVDANGGRLNNVLWNLSAMARRYGRPIICAVGHLKIRAEPGENVKALLKKWDDADTIHAVMRT